MATSVMEKCARDSGRRFFTFFYNLTHLDPIFTSWSVYKYCFDIALNFSWKKNNVINGTTEVTLWYVTYTPAVISTVVMRIDSAYSGTVMTPTTRSDPERITELSTFAITDYSEDLKVDRYLLGSFKTPCLGNRNVL